MTGLSTVKVDADTLRVIADLAHVLGRSRKDVVRDAVHAFAAWREQVLGNGLEETASRLALAGVRHHAQVVEGGLGLTDDERVERGRLGVARMSDSVFRALTPIERLEARRRELEDAFAALGAHHPRFVDGRSHGYLREHLVIAVVVDPHARFRELDLAIEARRILELELWVVLAAEPAD